MIRKCTHCGQRLPSLSYNVPISSRIAAYLHYIEVKPDLDFEWVDFVDAHLKNVRLKKVLFAMQAIDPLLCGDDFTFASALYYYNIDSASYDHVLDSLRKFSRNGDLMITNARFHQIVEELEQKEKASKLLP